MGKVSNEKELGNALKENQDTIEIEGNLATKVIRIKATGNVAWAVAIGGIGIAVIAILSGVAAPAALIGAPVAVVAIGGPVIFGSAVSIAVAGGGAAILNNLRIYEIKKISNVHIILNKK